MTKAVDRYSEKAASYTRGRWDYAPEAVDALFRECGLSEHSIIADVGSGTGMLARHFIARVRTVFAIEPNSDMRAMATTALRTHAAYHSLDGYSDATTLPDMSVDMITVGRALHWFPAQSTRAEFRRILKLDGWMAVFSVPCTDQGLLHSIGTLRATEYGWDTAADEERTGAVPLSFYFGHDDFRTLSFPGLVRETWEAFRRRICSFSGAPGVDHKLRPTLERALREVFWRHAADGVLTVSNATEVAFGRVHTGCRRIQE